MNIYDTANNLASEIKSSAEYIRLKDLKTKIDNSSKKDEIKRFENKKMELQIAKIKNASEFSENDTIELAKLYNELIQDETIREYFDAQIKFNQILVDINKIIGEAVKDLI